MKRKFINVTKEYIENLAPTDFCVELIQPAWETVNIYGSYEEYEESLKPYTTEQRYLLAMHWLGAEVDNGGFQQFLTLQVSFGKMHIKDIKLLAQKN